MARYWWSSSVCDPGHPHFVQATAPADLLQLRQHDDHGLNLTRARGQAGCRNHLLVFVHNVVGTSCRVAGNNRRDQPGHDLQLEY